MSNKYVQHYEKLIAKARARGGVDGYKERHHVTPRSIGGADEPENIVELTAREHLIAHLLLWKSDPRNFKLIHAAMLMSNRFTINSRTYEALRTAMAEARTGWNPSADVREQMSKGQKKRFSDPEQRRIQRDLQAGIPRPKPEGFGKSMSRYAAHRPEEHLEALSKAQAASWTDDRRQQQSKRMTGFKHTPSARKKMSEAKKGKVGNRLGQSPSEETRNKISEALKGHVLPHLNEQVVCPHCGKVGNKVPMARWHFDNCKGRS